jgi:flagellar hook assembly protein FlgD
MGDGQLISPNLVISETSIAYPNPAITSSTIRVVLSRNDNVQLSVEIYDFAGKKIRTLSVPSTTTNKVEVIWDLKNSSGTKMARGTYFARVVVSDSTTKQEKIIKIAVK